jgi:predicted RNA-binding Zn ribbon-like protein
MNKEAVPAELAPVRDFLNTLDIEDATDALPHPQALHDWLAEQGLLRRDARVTRGEFEQALALRAALRVLVSHHHNQRPRALAEAATLAARAYPLRVAFDEEGTPGLTADSDTVAGALARLLAGLPLAVAGGTWQRLKLCVAESCEWAYYDTSKNRSRRWCSMDICGNREKTRTFRERQAAQS